MMNQYKCTCMHKLLGNYYCLHNAVVGWPLLILLLQLTFMQEGSLPLETNALYSVHTSSCSLHITS